VFRSSFLRLVGLSTCLIAVGATKSAGASSGWVLERDVKTPSYAYVEPTSTNLNIDTVVLTCEQGRAETVLQLQLFLKDDGRLLPKGVLPSQLKEFPRAEIVIDGHAASAVIYFSGDHVVLADETRGRLPALSSRMLDAMASGTTMTLKFDLVREPAGKPAALDGEAVIDLQAGAGGRAVRAVRLCAGPNHDHRVDGARSEYAISH
jgi:hypothetical protein